MPDNASAGGDLPRRFLVFAGECRATSPLYRELSLAIAEDAELLSLAAQARSTPVPNLLFAAVHFLLLSGTDHELGRFYPSVGGTEDAPGAYPAFRDFCFRHRPEIGTLLQRRRVQTNEVRRSAVLLPALSIAASKTSEPLALVEIGASAGLNLLFDRYSYDYGGHIIGDSPLKLRCELRGDISPPLPPGIPEVVFRVGIDAHPLDIADPADRRWLEALIWPEQFRERAALQRTAAGIVREVPPRILKGDGATLLSTVLDETPEEATPCVFHTFTLNQMPRAGRSAISTTLRHHSLRRPLFRISIEWEPGEWPLLELERYAAGELQNRHILARCSGHGEWMEWIGDITT